MLVRGITLAAVLLVGCPPSNLGPPPTQCGALNGACCAGENCLMGTCDSIMNRCVESPRCTRPGVPCCEGRVCRNQALSCQNGLCMPASPDCGGSGQPCCTGPGQVPCRSTQETCTPEDGRCREATMAGCGGAGAPCCPDPPSGDGCAVPGICMSGTCVIPSTPDCGGAGEECCSGDRDPCRLSSLTCTEGRCVPMTSTECGEDGGSCCTPPETPCQSSNFMCEEGRCVPMTTAMCKGPQTACASVSECCSGLSCRTIIGTETKCCKEAGRLADTAIDCCGLLTRNASGACAQRGNGEGCADDRDCIMANCVIAAGQTTGLCGGSAPTCDPLGGVCNSSGTDNCCDSSVCVNRGPGAGSTCCNRDGGTCRGTPDCCPGLSCEGSTCRPDAPSCISAGQSCGPTDTCCSPTTCQSGTCSTPTACTASGLACRPGDTCCGNNSCDGTTCCVAIGTSCDSDEDECCGSSICGTGDRCCGLNGTPCSNAFDCCGARLCDGTRSVCCMPEGQFCTEHLDCCGALLCDNNECSPTIGT